MIEAHDWAMTLNKRILNSQKYYYVGIINKLDNSYKENMLNLNYGYTIGLQSK